MATVADWKDQKDSPECADGKMVPVILQVRGRVVGGWYLKRYELHDEYDSLTDNTDEDGYVTGYFDKVMHGEYEDYYELVPLKEIEAWAPMPEPKEVPAPATPSAR